MFVWMFHMINIVRWSLYRRDFETELINGLWIFNNHWFWFQWFNWKLSIFIWIQLCTISMCILWKTDNHFFFSSFLMFTLFRKIMISNSRNRSFTSFLQSLFPIQFINSIKKNCIMWLNLNGDKYGVENIIYAYMYMGWCDV